MARMGNTGKISNVYVNHPNKRLLGALTITCCFTLCGYSQSFLTNGLVAHYPFSGSANDTSGHGNDGSAQNVVYGIDRFGMQSSAVKFSGQLGTNSAINCPTLNALPYYTITYSCWFRLDGYTVADGEVMTLVGREQSDFPQTEGAIVLMMLKRSGFTNELTYFTPDAFHFNSFCPATNQWYHAVFTIDSSAQMSLFVDGSLYGTVQRTPSALDGVVPLPFRIGGSTYNPYINPSGNPGYPRYSWR
ncbi:MAG: LamG-like jellyroll fold domain-containing protein, partial [bacterium]